MTNGWARDDAVQQQIDSTVEDALQRVREELPKGDSLRHCEQCGAEIPRARREAVKGVRLCIDCQSGQDRARVAVSPYNRRGSKDSQLR